MANIIYSAMGGKNDPMFGKFEHPIKALIENESNICEKNKSIVDVLYNVEKSSRYAETIMGESDFGTFQAAEEGASPAEDTVQKTFDKTIEHIEFKKEFTITRKMADDAKFGIGSNIKSKPKKFVRAYYRTRIDIAAKALANGTLASMEYNGATVDLTTGDKNPLFYSEHPYAIEEISAVRGKQSNYFYGNLSESSEVFEETLGLLANRVRNFEDENGESMGYVADTLILPCNRAKLEMMAKRVVGSERAAGTNNNDINTQYGNWSIVVLPNWRTDDDRIMVMSSEANENLLANMFFNRVPLDITSDIDKHTRNYFWNGYCRFGLGFSTWKHMALMVGSETTVEGATAL